LVKLASMSDVISRKEESCLLELGRQVFLSDFPNPERKGCPGSRVLKLIAAEKASVADDDRWIDHCASCSPCYRELGEFRRAFVRQRRLRVLSATAILIAAVCVGTWIVMNRGAKSHGGGIAENRTPAGALEMQVLDLRGWSGARSDQAGPAQGHKPLELRRARTSLLIYLPMGSLPGRYNVEIAGGNRRALSANGIARIESGNTVLRVQLDLRKLSPGHYSLGIRQQPWDWRYYPLAVR
jgi:hypothetical protein